MSFGKCETQRDLILIRLKEKNYSVLFLGIMENDPRPLWLTYYSPSVEKNDHGRALPAKRTQVLLGRG